jgi:hypothetical protein
MLKRAYSLLISDKATIKQDQTEVSDNATSMYYVLLLIYTQTALFFF